MTAQLDCGHLTFQIVDMPDDEAACNGRAGDMDWTNLLIRIHKGAHPQHRRETILHEVLHVAWGFAGLGDGCSEESAVDGLTPTLLMIFRQNPWLVTLISGHAER